MEIKQQKYLTDKRAISEKYGDKNTLSKKLPKNPKYNDVKATVNTGKTIKDVVLESDQLVSKKKSELFKRVNGLAIVKLMNEVVLTESIYNLGKENESQNININNIQDNKSTMSNISKVNSVTSVTNSNQFIGDLSKISKYIIVDLRDVNEHNEYRIKDSVNMPYYNISRDKYPEQMYLMKNSKDKMIILYSSDERNSVVYTQLLYQKGFDNIYMLTGGIEVFVLEHPNCCEGSKMSTILLDIQKKNIKEKENLSKSRYKNTNLSNINKNLNFNNEASIKLNLNDKAEVVSSNVSTISGVSKVSQKSLASINTLKKNLAKK